MGIKKGFYLTAIFAVLLLTVSCGEISELSTADVSQSGQTPGTQTSEIQMPGTIYDGVYLSPDGDFTVNVDEILWTVKEDEGEQTLHLKENGNVWVSFSPAIGLTPDMLEDFEGSFVERYMEGVRVSYPDAKMAECKEISTSLARVDMTMSYGSGLYSMYQIMYLATDGKNGYIITALLPLEESERLRSSIYGMVESIRFLTASDE